MRRGLKQETIAGRVTAHLTIKEFPDEEGTETLVTRPF